MIYLNKNFKALVIYYSQKGNTRYLAQSIASYLQTDILEIKVINEKENANYKENNRFMFFKKLFSKPPEIESFNTDILKYDLIFIGSPVWNKKFALPALSLINKHEIKDKNIALFCSYLHKTGRAFKHIKNRLKDNLIAGEIAIQEPLRFGSSKELFKSKIIGWASIIAKKVRDSMKAPENDGKEQS